MKRCLKCGALLGAPREHPDGLPGILHEICGGCGWSRAITHKPRAMRLPAAPKPSAVERVVASEGFALAGTQVVGGRVVRLQRAAIIRTGALARYELFTFNDGRLAVRPKAGT